MANIRDIVRFSRIATNGIHLHAAEAGPPDGPLVILLHGFPEFWYSWRNQIEPLAQRGFHVVAPDQRGYNLSDKPGGVASYDLDQLSLDIAGLGDYFGHEKFKVVGHDWGASVGWWLAGLPATRVSHLAALNAPHPAVWLQAMRQNPVQKKKSRYVRLFRVPYLPELLIGLDRDKALAKGFGDCVRADAFTQTDLEQYRTAWAQPGTLTATINYYRALLSKLVLPAEHYSIRCPTLVIWGTRDAYGVPELAGDSAKLCTDARVQYLDGASHWVQHDEPEKVRDLLIMFLEGDKCR